MPGISAPLGSTTRDDGSKQLGIDCHPVYTFVGDKSPGEATGQGKTLNGGLWTVVASGHGPAGLSVLVAAALAVDGVVHLAVAGDYDVPGAGPLGEGNLFRAQAIVALLAAVWVLARPRPLPFAVAGIRPDRSVPKRRARGR